MPTCSSCDHWHPDKLYGYDGRIGVCRYPLPPLPIWMLKNSITDRHTGREQGINCTCWTPEPVEEPVVPMRPTKKPRSKGKIHAPE